MSGWSRTAAGEKLGLILQGTGEEAAASTMPKFCSILHPDQDFLQKLFGFWSFVEALRLFFDFFLKLLLHKGRQEHKAM